MLIEYDGDEALNCLKQVQVKLAKALRSKNYTVTV